MLTAAQQYIEDRIERIPESGCWIWMLACCTIGYGKACAAKIAGRNDMYAHRLSWLVYRGPITPGLKVLHRCDVGSCVNPSHLFLGTSGENSADMVAKGRSMRGERHHKAKLTEQQVREILTSSESGTAIAKRMGVNHSIANGIRRRESWKHLALDD